MLISSNKNKILIKSVGYSATILDDKKFKIFFDRTKVFRHISAFFK